MLESRNTKAMLVGLLAILCAQFAVAYLWTEPYPDVFEPGFPGSPPTAGVTGIRGYRVVASGPSDSTFVLDAERFFYDVPHWYLVTDMPFLLDSTPPERSGWWRVRGRLLRRAKLRSDAGLPEFASYAEQRLADVTGHADWDRLRIEEIRRSFNVGERVADSVRVLRSREFRLK